MRWRLDPQAGTRHAEPGEVQHVHLHSGGGLRSNRPRLGESGIDNAAAPIPNNERDWPLRIRNHGRVLRQAGEVTQLIHPDLWTAGHDVCHRPLWPTHSGSLWPSQLMKEFIDP